MSDTAEKIRLSFLGNVIPLEIRDNFARAKKDGGRLFIPYSCRKFWGRGECQSVLEDPEVVWWDGIAGIEIQL
jgi:hypothetical protein